VGPTPFQMPGLATSCWPTSAYPLTVGPTTAEGCLTEAATTAGVAVLKAFWIVDPFEACTTARSAWPRSAGVIAYAVPVAFGIAAQFRPFALHRSQRNASFAGTGLHVPVVTWTVFPCTGGPATTGCAVDSSRGRLGAIGPTSDEYAVPVPVVSVAYTASPTVWPTSRSPSLKVGEVAPCTVRHAAPAALQRYQRKR